MSGGFENFIRTNSYDNKRNQKQFKIFGLIDIFVIDPLPANVDILKVIDAVESKIPHHVANEVEAFYVGRFKEFEEKQVNAMYRDGAIYISNEQDNNEDMIDDLIHELAHAAEHLYAQEIYSDKRIQNEFLGKRKRLSDMIREYGYFSDDSAPSFSELEYTQELDNFLYKKLGYDKLETFCAGLFIRPYAVTDIREYFATAFECFLLDDRRYLKKISPEAYKKVAMVCSTEEV